jgi:hypothetical protein
VARGKDESEADERLAHTHLLTQDTALGQGIPVGMMDNVHCLHVDIERIPRRGIGEWGVRGVDEHARLRFHPKHASDRALLSAQLKHCVSHNLILVHQRIHANRVIVVGEGGEDVMISQKLAVPEARFGRRVEQGVRALDVDTELLVLKRKHKNVLVACYPPSPE